MIDPRRLRVLQAVAAHGSVEFPSVPALVAAGRGAGIIPRLALAQAQVTVCALPPLGGRHIAAWHQAGPPQPAPATATVLDALARAAHALD